jgi:hypothetical protein
LLISMNDCLFGRICLMPLSGLSRLHFGASCEKSNIRDCATPVTTAAKEAAHSGIDAGPSA